MIPPEALFLLKSGAPHQGKDAQLAAAKRVTEDIFRESQHNV